MGGGLFKRGYGRDTCQYSLCGGRTKWSTEEQVLKDEKKPERVAVILGAVRILGYTGGDTRQKLAGFERRRALSCGVVRAWPGKTVEAKRRHMYYNIFRQPIPQSGGFNTKRKSRDTVTCNSIWLDDLSFRDDFLMDTSSHRYSGIM